MAARKKWATTTVPSAKRRSHPSQVAVYRHVKSLAAQFRAGMLRPDLARVTVWIDERDGRGWQRYETVELAEFFDSDADADGGV